ncbi:hypothetical protein [Caulobacter sp. Root487D2Y]|jgi:hypothetical protein|uniref:hypothetical protein n=1 Tax=Caulobacter sp. Root487D2Y TaxID=1736547 RepID=UPI0012E3D6DE|nr:hypothetical protein [Caulobacter sp. Root487D2Y]
MKRGAVKASWWARGLMLLSAILLLGAPAMPTAAMPMDSSHAQAPCHDMDHDGGHDRGKSLCSDGCVVACQVIAAPGTQIAEPVETGLAIPAPTPSPWPPGRAPAPELPPPR